MKKFFKEFRNFAVKGNVIDLAVGIIIGGAFQKIVSSTVNDLFMPIFGLITNNADFRQKYFVIRETTFNYGTFLSSVLDFVIMAFIIFLMVKTINKIKHFANNHPEKTDEKNEPDTKKCPFCLSDIPFAAVKCAHCTSDIPEPEPEEESLTESSNTDENP